MSDSYDDERRIVHGREVQVQWFYDNDHGAPWAEHDGHGPVRESKHFYGKGRHGDKHPGERPLNKPDHNSYQYFYNSYQYFYDWQSAMKIARKDGWGVSIDTFMALTAKHRRVPTKGMCVEAAVQSDFDYCSGWANDDWYWCGIEVTDVETGIEASLWGIESTNEHGYHDEIICDLANDMWSAVCEALIAGNLAA